MAQSPSLCVAFSAVPCCGTTRRAALGWRREDGTVTTFRARERPHLIFDGNGDPTHFINGVGDPCPGGGGKNTGCPVRRQGRGRRRR